MSVVIGTEKVVLGKEKLMKKMIILAMAAMLTLTACGPNQATGTVSDTGSSAEVTQKEEAAKTEETDSAKSEVAVQSTSVSAVEEETESGKKTLIAYFSWSGNTKDMATYIAEQTGGDVFEIQPAVAYPED